MSSLPHSPFSPHIFTRASGKANRKHGHLMLIPFQLLLSSLHPPLSHSWARLILPLPPLKPTNPSCTSRIKPVVWIASLEVNIPEGTYREVSGCGNSLHGFRRVPAFSWWRHSAVNQFLWRMNGRACNEAGIAIA